MSDSLHLETRGQVLILQITEEKSLNSLNNRILDEMVEVIRSFERDPQLRALVLTGSGRAFCTGADLKAFRDFEPDYIVEYCVEYGETLFNALATMKKPTIAAVNGYALGGGMELALACDFRVASSTAVFSAPEYGFGWVPGWGGVSRLSKLVGAAKAKEILLLKKRVKAPEALALGMVTEVAEPEEMLEKAVKIGEKLAELSPPTVGYTKAILNEFSVPLYDSYLQGFTNGLTSKMPYARREIDQFMNRGKKKDAEKQS